MNRKAYTDKILVIGVDGLDPRLSKKYIAEGRMPNFEKLIARGSCREDLSLLGAQPTVTPPMWTTLATGTYPVTHGITCYNRKGADIDEIAYNLDSRNCKAEQLWNVFAEAGKKTLVWHWPGSSWPPSSDSPNLSVVDGLTPACVDMLCATDSESVLIASEGVTEVSVHPRAASDGNIPCVIEKLEDKGEAIAGINGSNSKPLILKPEDGEHALSDSPFDVILTPIKPAEGWSFEVPAGAKETIFVFSGGFIRRPCLILKNEQGIYDRVAVYLNKKTAEPLAVLENDVYYKGYIDDNFRADGSIVKTARNMRIIEMKEDGSYLKVWRSFSMDSEDNQYWHPQELKKKIVDNVSIPVPLSIVGGGDRTLIEKCMIPTWEHVGEFYSKSIHYLIENEGYEVVFSHYHNIDIQGHMIVKFLKDHGHNKLSEDTYENFMREIYEQTDRYVGSYLHLLDEGWTLFLVSDHAQVAPEHEPFMIGDTTGINVRVMQELGLCETKRDENGNELYEFDWDKTYAVAQRGNHIYLNIKGRDPHGIIDPKDQYEWEEEIMTRLYSYKSPETGKRIIALALRNKDAVLLGLGGPEAGDIIYWNAEGYNYDHCDSLSTTYGCRGTSVGPIFIAAGSGIKKGYTTTRIIRQVDVAPTIAYLGGVRMPRECEGALAYQIFEEEF